MYIILKLQEDVGPISPEDLVVLNDEGNVAVFDTPEEASDFREDNAISGQIVNITN